MTQCLSVFDYSDYDQFYQYVNERQRTDRFRACAWGMYEQRQSHLWQILAESQNDKDRGKASNVHTLVPLPSLKPIDVVPMYDDSRHFVIVNLINGSSSFSCQSFSRITKNQVDLSCNSFSSFRMVPWKDSLISKLKSLDKYTYR